jgi:hypothetical protein
MNIFMVVRMAEDNKHYVIISINKDRDMQNEYRDLLNDGIWGERYEVVAMSVEA